MPRKKSKPLQTMGQPQSSMNMKWLLLLVPVVLILIVLAWFIGTYNALISADQNVKQTWADVQVQYQRRIDLIPNLVNSVKGYMQYERGLLENITALRTQWMAAQASGDVNQQVQVSNQMEAALRTVILTYEAYPQLQADKTVTALMDELAGTENRIAVARMNYNNAVISYNKLVLSVPSNFVAGIYGYAEKIPFNAIAGSDLPPVVNLTS